MLVDLNNANPEYAEIRTLKLALMDIAGADLAQAAEVEKRKLEEEDPLFDKPEHTVPKQIIEVDHLPMNAIDNQTS